MDGPHGGPYGLGLISAAILSKPGKSSRSNTLQARHEEPNEKGIQGVKKNVVEVEQPGKGLGASFVEPQHFRQRKLRLKAQEGQRLIQVSVERRKQFDRMVEGRVVHQHVIQGKPVIVTADEPAAKGRNSHGHSRQKHDCALEEQPGSTATSGKVVKIVQHGKTPLYSNNFQQNRAAGFSLRERLSVVVASKYVLLDGPNQRA
ncbi:MAG: hypothetical protein IIC01_05335 [Planctomycetes bacterium]|nr:hypothetical protein [Planctomycetota bacterium]